MCHFLGLWFVSIHVKWKMLQLPEGLPLAPPTFSSTCSSVFNLLDAGLEWSLGVSPISFSSPVESSSSPLVFPSCSSLSLSLGSASRFSFKCAKNSGMLVSAPARQSAFTYISVTQLRWYYFSITKVATKKQQKLRVHEWGNKQKQPFPHNATHTWFLNAPRYTKATRFWCRLLWNITTFCCWKLISPFKL